MNLHEIAEQSMFNKIALRVMTGGKVVKPGDKLDNSFVWVDGVATDEELEGTCGIDCGFDGFDELTELDKAMSVASNYEGQLVLIGSNSPDCYEGNDPGEVVMPNAEVIAVIK